MPGVKFMISFSIVIPVYSGDDYLETLAVEIEAYRQKLDEVNAPFRLREVVFVDDESIDNSREIIADLVKKYNYFLRIQLSRNYGQHSATMAGILHSSGDWVVTMDEDLQHHPKFITELFGAVVKNESDIVYGRPSEGAHQSKLRDLGSKYTKKVVSGLSGSRHITNASSFRLIRGSIARAASSMAGHDTYFDVALGWFTQRVSALQLPLKDTRYIENQKSGYNFKSLASHSRRMMFSGQIKALRYGALFGVILAMFALLASAYIFISRAFGYTDFAIRGWTSTMVAIMFLGGVIVFLLGIILEYISTLVQRAHGKPVFFIVDRDSDSQLREFFENQS